MKVKVIAGIVLAGCIAYGATAGVNYVNHEYNDLRMSSPQTEIEYKADDSFLQRLEAVVEYDLHGDENNVVTMNYSNATTNTMESGLKTKYEAANKVSKNVIGWIEIPGTDVDYPINYASNDNNYYLHHNWENKPYWNGAIFLDSANSGFQNWSLINGHNMLNGIMFAQLLNYENKGFAEKNPYIYVYQGLNDNKLSVYKIIGATYAPDDVKFTLGNLNEQERASQISTLMKNPIYKLSDYNKQDVLMLNTCLSNGTTNHLILIAQKVD